jgi:hypothetical protein
MPTPTRRRVIVDSDAKNEADDQFAIVHALLSPSLDLRGLVAAHFGTHRTTRSMEESRAEIDRLLRLCPSDVPVANGAPRPLPDESTPMDSPGVVNEISNRIAVIHHGKIVELGEAHQVATAPRHEYTRRLQMAAPVADPKLQRERRELRLSLLAAGEHDPLIAPIMPS